MEYWVFYLPKEATSVALKEATSIALHDTTVPIFQYVYYFPISASPYIPIYPLNLRVSPSPHLCFRSPHLLISLSPYLSLISPHPRVTVSQAGRLCYLSFHTFMATSGQISPQIAQPVQEPLSSQTTKKYP